MILKTPRIMLCSASQKDIAESPTLLSSAQKKSRI